jgi:hypothetical protein
MNGNEIDRALVSELEIEPGSDFSARVMVAVRQQVSQREAMAFPWSRLLPGLVAWVAVVAVTFVVDPAPAAPAFLVAILENPIVLQVFGWISSSLLGAWVLVWMSMRLAGATR